MGSIYSNLQRQVPSMNNFFARHKSFMSSISCPNPPKTYISANIKHPFQPKQSIVRDSDFCGLFPALALASHDPPKVMLMLRRLSSDLSEGGGSPRHRPERGKHWPEPVGGGIIDSALAPLSGISGLLVGKMAESG